MNWLVVQECCSVGDTDSPPSAVCYTVKCHCALVSFTAAAVGSLLFVVDRRGGGVCWCSRLTDWLTSAAVHHKRCLPVLRCATDAAAVVG